MWFQVNNSESFETGVSGTDCVTLWSGSVPKVLCKCFFRQQKIVKSLSKNTNKMKHQYLLVKHVKTAKRLKSAWNDTYFQKQALIVFSSTFCSSLLNTGKVVRGFHCDKFKARFSRFTVVRWVVEETLILVSRLKKVFWTLMLAWQSTYLK